VDVRTRHEVLHLLGQLHGEGLGIVLSTHDLNGIAAHLPMLLCLNVTVAGRGAPRDVLTPEILERVYGAPMDVLEHAGMILVVDRAGQLGSTSDIRRMA
jgi:ABC-type Mn2+/Zn2+ transport system ATPase subunit